MRMQTSVSYRRSAIKTVASFSVGSSNGTELKQGFIIEDIMLEKESLECSSTQSRVMNTTRICSFDEHVLSFA